MNQSRPCWLRCDGGGLAGTGSGTTVPPAGRSRRSLSSPAIKRNGRATGSLLPLVVEFPGIETAGGAEHDDRRILLVFGRLVDLLLGQFQRDAVAFVGDRAEAKRAPVDDDLAAADAEETAEIDHGSADYAVAVDNGVDNAAHVLVGGAPNLAAEDAVRIARPDDGDGDRRRGLLRILLRNVLCGTAPGRFALRPYAGGHGERHGQHGNKPFSAHLISPSSTCTCLSASARSTPGSGRACATPRARPLRHDGAAAD